MWQKIKVHLGSTLVMIFAFLSFAGSLNRLQNNQIPQNELGAVSWAPALFLIALAYRSAKKRKIGEKPNTKTRLISEM